MLRLLPWKSQLAIDVGTASCHISVHRAGVVVREPTVIAFDADRRRPIAFGAEAKQMLDREVSDVQVLRPLQGGVIADFDAATLLLRHLMHQALGHRPLLAPLVVTGEPTRTTQVQHRALVNALRAAGAGEVVPVPRALAAAVGAGVPMDQPECRLVVDMGAGATDIGVISAGMIAAGQTIQFGGDDLDEAIRRYVRRRYRMSIGAARAEDVKIMAGALSSDMVAEQVRLADLAGEEASAADAQKLEGIAELMRAALKPAIAEVLWVLEGLPERQMDEITQVDAVLTGGCALLRGIASMMSEELALNVVAAPDPMSCTILGLEAILNDLDALSLDGRRFTR
ncbi:MAG: rod shape-determining protein [Armatimonadota bacterium]